MYCNLSKTQVLPTAFRVTTHFEHMGLNPHTMSKFQSFSNRVYPKPLLNPRNVSFDAPRRVLLNKTRKIRFSFGGLCSEFGLEVYQLKGVRNFSSVYDGGHRNGVVRNGGNDLPWLSDSGQAEVSKSRDKVRKVRVSGGAGGKSSWESSNEKFVKRSGGSVVEDEVRRSRGFEASKMRDKIGKGKTSSGGGSSSSKSSWEISAEKFVKRSGGSVVEDEGRRSRAVDVVDNWRKPHVRRDETIEDDGEGEGEVVNDPRWDKIKSRAGRVVESRGGFDKPEMRRWNREENWGRKTYREASESTVPKMVGEGLYGVGPVLAALSAGRREFYALYVQEGLELSKSNRKRKDKKGFEKVLKIAESIGLSLREVSKHDLNMVSDNRPHQGLVLDTSPLEMVNIKELETVSTEHDKGVLWIALDEVTDPQNLGAIIRSSYFFGATGVVLCAKNSAPLSGVVSKASAGSLELMEMRSCKNMMQFLTSSADNGWRVVGGSVSSRAVPLREVSPGEPTILVLGSEGTGLRPLVERSCSHLVKIPGNIPMDVTSGRFEDDDDEDENDGVVEQQSSGEEFRSFMAVESLNVSVAAGVLLHHFIGNNYTSLDHQGNVDNNTVE